MLQVVSNFIGKIVRWCVSEWDSQLPCTLWQHLGIVPSMSLAQRVWWGVQGLLNRRQYRARTGSSIPPHSMVVCVTEIFYFQINWLQRIREQIIMLNTVFSTLPNLLPIFTFFSFVAFPLPQKQNQFVKLVLVWDWVHICKFLLFA